MARQKWADSEFGHRLKAERERQGWTQPQIAKMLSDRCAQPIHATTIAKIEAGTRSVRINEAVAMADLFEVSIDALLGRRQPDDTTLTYAMVNLSKYAHDAQSTILRAQHTTADITEILEDVAERFDLPYTEGLQEATRDMAEQLERAHALAAGLAQSANQAISDESEEAE
jgi:transcriptional regulator with XRE-family HTH domain